MIVPSPEDFLSTTISGLRITEPTTAITDLIIAIVAIILSLLIYGHVKTVNKNLVGKDLYWCMFFLFMGLSTFAGAITHGLRFYLPGNKLVCTFLFMNGLSLVSSLFAQLATIEYEIKGKKPWMRIVTVIGFILFLVTVLTVQSFAVTNIYATLTFLFVLYHHWRSWKNGKLPSKYIVYGILISFITAIVFLMKISFSEWFNHKDIAHVFILISIIVMFRGAKHIHSGV
jgi:hypothetical protein